MKPFELCCGAKLLRVHPPPGCEVEVAAPPKGATPPAGSATLAEAMARPRASSRLAELARGAERAVLVHTDSSRPCPDAELLAAAARELELAKVGEITLLCGLGAHRPSTPEERQGKLASLVERYPAIDHTCSAPGLLADLGPGPHGVPLAVNRLAAEADLVVSTGIVEPHQYAGYSGGPKTLAIGAGGEATIAATHSPDMIEQPGCRPGLLKGNPFQEVISESARRAGLSFVINVVRCGRGWAYFAGEPTATHEAAARFGAELFEVALSRDNFDVAVCGVPDPKSRSLYQASRAASYLALSPRPVLAEGAAIILACTLEEGAGAGPAERRFLAAMEAAESATELVDRLRDTTLRPGEQRAFMMALARESHRVVVVSERPEVVGQAKLFEAAASIEEALKAEAARLGRPPRILVLPDAMSALPYPAT